MAIVKHISNESSSGAAETAPRLLSYALRNLEEQVAQLESEFKEKADAFIEKWNSK